MFNNCKVGKRAVFLSDLGDVFRYAFVFVQINSRDGKDKSVDVDWHADDSC